MKHSRETFKMHNKMGQKKKKKNTTKSHVGNEKDRLIEIRKETRIITEQSRRNMEYSVCETHRGE